MRVVYTEPALRDLEEVLDYIAAEFPGTVEPFKQRLRMIEARIGRWPDGARHVDQRPDVRVVPMVRYPYRIFYRLTGEAVEILHIHHAARREP